jgi:hypothetical protein
LLSAAHDIVKEFSTNNPKQDQMRIYPFIRDKK